MDDIKRSCTWDVFCEHLASFAGDDDFALVVQDMDIDLGPLKDLPEEKVFVSAPLNCPRCLPCSPLLRQSSCRQACYYPE